MSRNIKSIVVMAMLTILSVHAFAQSVISDSLYTFREFAKLGQLYKKPPVKLTIHIQNTANPITTASDTMQTDMDLYYGMKEFYMQTEGLEEIVNDSLAVMVNSRAKQMIVLVNGQQIIKNIEKYVSMFMPDSSADILSRRYRSAITDAGQNKRKIELISRETVFGTNIPKETVFVTYRNVSYEPVEFSQTKVRLVPVDSMVYHELRKDPAYTAKLVSAPSANGDLFFIVKELNTSCIFNKIDYQAQHPPAGERDRIIMMPDGEYRPAKGFEDYVLSKQ